MHVVRSLKDDIERRFHARSMRQCSRFPANSQDHQKQAPIDATKAAGIKIVKRIQERTTAGIASAGDSAVPSSHAVAQLAALCAGKEANCAAASPELMVSTERWGNVDNTPARRMPNAIDISKLVDKLKDVPGAYIEARCQLRDATPNPYGLAVNAQDIGRIVDAVKGQPYPFTISVCP
jgi:hypothetical protein